MIIRSYIILILNYKINIASSIECAESVDNLTFGEIKCLFESICDRLYETKNGKKLIARYVKALREDKNASLMYSIYEAFRNPEMFENKNSLASNLGNVLSILSSP